MNIDLATQCDRMLNARRKQGPMNKAFNDACCFIAAKIFPLGFDVRKAAPNTMLELSMELGICNRMAIWEGDYSATCFGDTETWWQFRAWHDWVHHRYDCAFDMQGEHKACHIQAGQLMRTYGRGDDVRDMIALLFCNVIGQLEEGHATGKPVKDGRAYCDKHCTSWTAYADNIIAAQGFTDVDAIRFSGSAYGLRKSFGPAVPTKEG